ncbi:hypothetical protein PT974_01512 [Cladobotryum mycophilum]|uniref:PD-(D/E)XK nuclease-like domain-containing protein n=1 Tax=Cladobotryum mycophilum TaxID=491253 RepID=A0ABR0T3U0_9HYPO
MSLLDTERWELIIRWLSQVPVPVPVSAPVSAVQIDTAHNNNSPSRYRSSSSLLSPSAGLQDQSAALAIARTSSSLKRQRLAAADSRTTSIVDSPALDINFEHDTDGTLDKPVTFAALHDNATEQLPDDVRQLYNRIYDIAVGRDAFLPHLAHEEICAAAGRSIKSSWFTKPHPLDDINTRLRCLREVEELRRIVAVARECLQVARSEAAWNLDVHGPLLSLALELHPSVKRELATTAYIADSFLPSGTSGDSKMVDFVLVLDTGSGHAPGPDGGLLRTLESAAWSQPGDMQCINQTHYAPLQLRPIAVSIVTKNAGSAEDGRSQLGVWTAAWHQRMELFFEAIREANGEEGERRVITLPLLLIVEHEWRLLFACDRGHRLEILEDLSIGDTKSFIGCYTVLAVLREIANYVETTFRDWVVEVFDPDDESIISS